MAKLKTALYLIAPLVVFSLIATLMISKAILLKDCWAVDPNDDANHTFPGLFIAQRMLTDGALPQINFFNNFGSPILGDALTYPFSIESLTYYFVPNYWAMTVNRVLVAFATMLAGFVFYRSRMSRPSAILCSALSFLAAVSIWFSTTYHMNLAPLFLFLILICVEGVNAGKKPYLAGLFLTLVFMWLSLSINLAAMLFVYTLLFQLACDRLKLSRNFWVVTATAGLSIVSVFFQFMAFYEGMKTSVRGVSHYDSLSVFEPSMLLHHVFSTFNRNIRMHPDAAVFLSVPVVAFGCLGLMWLARSKRSDLYSVALLGFAPILTSFLLLMVPDVWWSLPLVKSIDLTRVIWISIPFLILSVGYGLKALREENPLTKKMWAIPILVLSAAAALRFGIYGDQYAFGPDELLILFAVAAISLGFLVPIRWPIVSLTVAVIALVISPATSFIQIMGLARPDICHISHPFSELWNQEFPYEKTFAKVMHPNLRMADNEPTATGTELRGVFDGFLGSGQRAIVSTRRLLEYLDGLDVIQTEHDVNTPYSFRPPWDSKKLAKLGIRYAIDSAANEGLRDAGWDVLGFAHNRVLLENKLAPTPIYLGDDKPTFLTDYSFNNNTIDINLPQSANPQVLTATFVNYPAYKIFVDGEERPMLESKDPFIHVQLRPNDHHVSIEYRQFTWLIVLAYLLAGISGFATLYRFGVR